MANAFHALISLLHDPSALSTIAVAVLTAHLSVSRACSSRRCSLDTITYVADESSSDPLSRTYSATLARNVAMFLPFAAAGTLVLFFYLFDKVGPFLILTSALVGVTAIYFVIHPFLRFLLQCCVRACYQMQWCFPTQGGKQRCNQSSDDGIAPDRGTECVEVARFVTGLISFVLIISWLFTGHWVLNDVIGACLCMLFVSLIKAPSLKIVTVLQCGLLVYDVIFVFFSERFVGKNVMVEVASSAARNPANILSKFFDLSLAPVEKIAFPGKLVFPSLAPAAPPNSFCILGLGDIIIPSMLLVYLCTFDNSDSRALSKPGFFVRYYCQALIAYAGGLFISFLLNVAYSAAQPALLYIVPLMLLSTCIIAVLRGEMASLWNGTMDHMYNSTDCEEQQPLASHVYDTNLSGLV